MQATEEVSRLVREAQRIAPLLDSARVLVGMPVVLVNADREPIDGNRNPTRNPEEMLFFRAGCRDGYHKIFYLDPNPLGGRYSSTSSVTPENVPDDARFLPLGAIARKQDADPQERYVAWIGEDFARNAHRLCMDFGLFVRPIETAPDGAILIPV